MGNLTGQNAIQALAVSGLRQTASTGGLPGATIVIRSDGGTSVSPFVSLQAARNAGALVTGTAQVVEFQNVTPGVMETQTLPLSNLNFSSGSYLQVRIRAGDAFRWNNPGGTSWDIGGSSYIDIDLTSGTSKCGIVDTNWQWNVNSFSCLPNTSQANGLLVYNSSHHIRIRGPGFSRTQAPGFSNGAAQFGGGTNFTCNLVDGSCSFIEITGCVFGLHGNNHYFNTAQNRYLNGGNLLEFDPTSGVFQNNDVWGGGHDAFVYAGVAGVVYNNRFSNNWLPWSGLTQYPGCRIASFAPNSRCGFGVPNGATGGNTNLKFSGPFGANLIMGNIFQDANEAGGAFVDVPCIKLQGEDIVLIGNYFTDNPVGWAYYRQLFGASSVSAQTTAHIRSAHNTMLFTAGYFRTDTILLNSSDSIPPTEYEFMRNEANLLYGVTLNTGFPSFVRWQDNTNLPLNLSTALGLQGGTARNQFKASTIINNLIYGQPGAAAGWDTISVYYGPGSGAAPFDKPLTGWASADVTGLANVNGNVRCVSGQPLSANNIDFVSLGSAPARQVTGLKLAATSTAGIGTAPPRTAVTAASSGTTLTVQDPNWWPSDIALTDAFLTDLATFKLWVAVGPNAVAAASNTAQVTGLSRTALTLTLASAVVANVNDGVWICGLGGTGVWDNFGAAQ